MSKVKQLNKTKIMNDIILKYNKKYDSDILNEIDYGYVSTGSHLLDFILGYGYPLRKFIHIWGPQSSGKTSLALATGAAVAKQLGGMIAYHDLERGGEISRLNSLNLEKNKDYKWFEPTCAEQFVDILSEFLDNDLFPVHIIDSMAAFIPQAEIEGGIKSSDMGRKGKLESKMYRVITNKFSNSNSIVIIISQTRTNFAGSISYDKASTGNATNFYAGIEMKMKSFNPKDKKVQIIEDGRIVGYEFTMELKKLKTGVIHNYGDIKIPFYINGFDEDRELIELGKLLNIVEGTTWLKYKDVTLGNGISKSVQFLKENEEFRKVFKKDIISAAKTEVGLRNSRKILTKNVINEEE